MKFFKFKRKSTSAGLSSPSSTASNKSATPTPNAPLPPTSSRPSLPSLPALPRQIPSFMQKHELSKESTKSTPLPEFVPLIDVIETQKKKTKKNESFADSVFASLEALYNSTDVNDIDSSMILFDEPIKNEDTSTKKTLKSSPSSSSPNPSSFLNSSSNPVTSPPRVFHPMSPPRPSIDQIKEANIQAILGMVTPPSTNPKSDKFLKITSPPSPSPMPLPNGLPFSTASTPFSQSGQHFNKANNLLQPISPPTSAKSTTTKSTPTSAHSAMLTPPKSKFQLPSTLASHVNRSTNQTTSNNSHTKNDKKHPEEDDEKIIAAILRRRSLKTQMERRAIPKADSNSSSSSSSSGKEQKKKELTSRKVSKKEIHPPKYLQAAK